MLLAPATFQHVHFVLSMVYIFYTISVIAFSWFSGDT